MAVCVGTSVYIVLVLYNQYKVSPIIVTFATKTTPIHDIPFPAVTICPASLSVMSKLNFSKLEDVINLEENVTAEDIKLYEYASQVCIRGISNVNIMKNATDFYKTLLDVSSFHLLLNALQKVVCLQVKPDLLGYSRCTWLGATVGCNNIFTEIITDKGICYAFNLIDRKEMFRDETYVKEICHHFYKFCISVQCIPSSKT